MPNLEKGNYKSDIKNNDLCISSYIQHRLLTDAESNFYFHAVSLNSKQRESSIKSQYKKASFQMIVDITFLRNCPVFYLQEKNAHYSILYHFLQAGIGLLLFDGKIKKFYQLINKWFSLSFVEEINRKPHELHC